MVIKAIIFLAGFLAGIFFLWLFCKRRKNNSCGSIKVFDGDSDGPYLFLDLSISIPELRTKKEASFSIEDINNPQS